MRSGRARSRRRETVSTPEGEYADGSPRSVDLRRRRMIKHSLVAAGVAWTAPVVSTIRQPVAAAVGSGSCPYTWCFDTGTTEGWTIVNGLTGLWNVNNGRSVSPSFSLHYGRGVGGTYDTVGRNSGTVVSPLIAIPVSGGNLTFNLWRQVETFGSGTWDEFTVRILPGNAVIYARSRDGGTGGVFVPVNLSLNAYAGTSIQIVFGFDTKDGANNNFEGVYVDDVTVPCVSPPPGALGFSGTESSQSLSSGQNTPARYDDREPTAQDLRRRARGIGALYEESTD